MTPNDTTQNFQARFQRYRKEYPTLKDATYYAMRDAILLNFFENEITEAQVATLLSISRTPIREAMLQLSRDGLLEISPGRKARIVPRTAQDLSDISTILDSLHTLSASLCIDRADDNSLRQLEECVALIRFYTDRMDLRHLAECNTRFHVQIAKAGGNRWLADIMSRLLCLSRICRFPSRSHGNGLPRTRRNLCGTLPQGQGRGTTINPRACPQGFYGRHPSRRSRRVRYAYALFRILSGSRICTICVYTASVLPFPAP